LTVSILVSEFSNDHYAMTLLITILLAFSSLPKSAHETWYGRAGWIHQLQQISCFTSRTPFISWILFEFTRPGHFGKLSLIPSISKANFKITEQLSALFVQVNHYMCYYRKDSLKQGKPISSAIINDSRLSACLSAKLLLQDIVNAPEARSGSRLFGYLCYFIMNISLSYRMRLLRSCLVSYHLEILC